MVEKVFCDKCGEEIVATKDKPRIENILFIRIGEREITDKELCNLCQCEIETILRKFFLNKIGEEINILKQECHKWKETCEILADPEIKKSITKSLKQFAEGKGIKLEDL